MDDNNLINEELTLGLMLEKTTRAVKLQFHHLFKAHNLNLTPEQWAIMDILYNEGTLSQKQITELVFKDAPSVSRLLEGLIKKEFISKIHDESDRRVTSVSLTWKGKDIVNTFRPKVIELRKMGMKNIDPNSLDQFLEVLNQVYNNYKK